eukprot:gene6693-4791_t
MVLNKWAVVNKSAPPPAGLRPLARTVLHHPKLIPAGYKTPFVMRPFIQDRHTSELQHIENRGLYREELSIERSRFPRMNKTFVIQTDGSINQHEMEFVLPPVVLLFHDRLSAFRQRQMALAKIGQLKAEHSWVPREITADQGPEAEDDLSLSLGNTSDDCERGPLCNAMEFPYCVPRSLRPRACATDPLSAKSIVSMRSKVA